MASPSAQARNDDEPFHDEPVTLAAARILARRHRPDWRPADNAELDAWATGFNTGWTQGYTAGRGDA